MSEVFRDAIRSFLAPIQHLLDDENVTEVMINGSDDIWVEVNDRPVAFEPTPDAEGNRRELIIPQDLLALDFGFCRIRFATPPPVQLSPSDARTLGVCVGRIEFECLDP